MKQKGQMFVGLRAWNNEKLEFSTENETLTIHTPVGCTNHWDTGSEHRHLRLSLSRVREKINIPSFLKKKKNFYLSFLLYSVRSTCNSGIEQVRSAGAGRFQAPDGALCCRRGNGW